MSAFTYQLSDARNDIGIKNISGVCSSSTALADYVNRATRRLMKRGGWFGTEVAMRLCTGGCDVVFPRHVGTVLALRLCNSDYMQIRNNWWSILSPGNVGGWNNAINGSGFGYGAAAGGYSPAGIAGTTVPIFNQISGNEGKLIRYHVVKAQDVGKTITLFGFKYGNQPLQEQVSGAWQNGITLTAASPSIPAPTPLVTRITSVVREATQGMAYLYEYDTVTTKLRMLATYEPNETNPSYRHMAIPALTCTPYSTDEYDVKTWQMEALVKLQYIPVENENDFLLISDFDALAMAIQSIKYDEAGDSENAEKYMLKAIRELNFELRDRSPADQLSVRVNVMGSNRMIQNPI